MQRLASGQVLISLKKKWSDGTFAKLFEPADLIAKVIALVPAPGANLVRFHGQFAPNARWRAFITSFAPAKRKRPPPDGTEEQRQRRMSWAVLLRRSFAIDALACECGGRRELIAVIEHKPTVCKILEHLGLESELPAFAAPRGPPLFDEVEAEAPAADDGFDVGDGAEVRIVADLDFVEPDYG